MEYNVFSLANSSNTMVYVNHMNIARYKTQKNA